MAINNPQSNFNWRLDLDDVSNERLQNVQLPSVEWTEHKQGTQGNDPDTKTPGKKIVGDMTAEMVVPDTGDTDLWNKLNKAKTMKRSQYCGNGVLYELDANGQPVQTHILENVWIKKVETANYETKGDNSDNLIRTVTFSVGDTNVQ